MANLKEIRNRVRSVKNTQKITRAMKLVAAAKLRRAQDAAEAARPYAERMQAVIATLAGAADADSSPLFRKSEQPGRVLLLLMSSDRGLCGGFNSQLFRRVNEFIRDNHSAFETIEVAAIGRKGRDFVRREALPALEATNSLASDGSITTARQVARLAVDKFVAEDYDRVYLVYNEFQSALQQDPTIEQLLPLDPTAMTDSEADAAAADDASSPDFLFEPGQQELLDVLLPQYIDTRVFRGLLESQASEQGARMTAMDNATNNADDLIEKLTLQMNRARQAIITTELMEITAGAEALNG